MSPLVPSLDEPSEGSRTTATSGAVVNSSSEVGMSTAACATLVVMGAATLTKVLAQIEQRSLSCRWQMTVGSLEGFILVNVCFSQSCTLPFPLNCLMWLDHIQTWQLCGSCCPRFGMLGSSDGSSRHRPEAQGNVAHLAHNPLVVVRAAPVIPEVPLEEPRPSAARKAAAVGSPAHVLAPAMPGNPPHGHARGPQPTAPFLAMMGSMWALVETEEMQMQHQWQKSTDHALHGQAAPHG